MSQSPIGRGGGSAAPTSPDYALPPEPPTWPKGLGVFSIVWGSLGVVCGGCVNFFAFAGSAFYEWGRQQQAKAGQPDMGPMPDPFKTTSLEMLSAGIWLIAVIVLLIAGICLVRRATAGRSLHLVYAVLSILSTLMGVAAAFGKAGGINSWIAANPGHPFLKNPGVSLGGSPMFGMVMGFCSLIYPVFILIWFLAIKKSPADMGRVVEEPLV